MKKHLLLVGICAVLLSGCAGEKTVDKAKDSVSTEEETGGNTKNQTQEAVKEADSSQTEKESEAKPIYEEEESLLSEPEETIAYEYPQDVSFIPEGNGSVLYGPEAFELEYKEDKLRLSYGDDFYEAYLDGAYGADAYFIPRDENCFLVLAESFRDNDGGDVRLFTYQRGEGFAESNPCTGWIEAADQEAVNIGSYMQLLGTYRISRVYSYGEGELSAAGGDDIIFDKSDRSLLLAMELAAYDEEGNPVTIPAGEVLLPIGCNEKEQHFRFSWNEEHFYLVYEWKDGSGYTVNDIPDTELFSGLEYAG